MVPVITAIWTLSHPSPLRPPNLRYVSAPDPRRSFRWSGRRPDRPAEECGGKQAMALRRSLSRERRASFPFSKENRSGGANGGRAGGSGSRGCMSHSRRNTSGSDASWTPADVSWQQAFERAWWLPTVSPVSPAVPDRPRLPGGLCPVARPAGARGRHGWQHFRPRKPHMLCQVRFSARLDRVCTGSPDQRSKHVLRTDKGQEAT